MSSLTTFRREHGDPRTWSAAEFEEYFATSDQTQDVYDRLDKAAAFMEANPGATSDQILVEFAGGVAR